jgi:hypothetical protein
VPAPPDPAAAPGRRYGLDWLRIAAFGLLILYHIGMVFVVWDYHVKSAVAVEWIEWPMLALNPWRLALLFLVSGVASRFLLAKLGGAGRFAGARSKRLLIPLLVGMVAIVAPQPWAELQSKHGYAQGFAHFWAHDYWRFGKLDGVDVPTWNHLWFVAYLWVYALLLAAARALLSAPARAALQRGFERLLGGWRLYALPVAAFALIRGLLQPIWPENHALIADWYAHAFYLLAFTLGVGLARADALLARLARAWPWLIAAACAGFAARMAWYAHIASPDPSTAALALGHLARATQTWGAIAGLVGFATARLNVDHPLRRALAEAVFPAYIVHQTALLLVAHWTNRAGWDLGPQFAAVLAATVAACALAAILAPRLGPLGVALGVAPRAKPLARPPASAAQRG